MWCGRSPPHRLLHDGPVNETDDVAVANRLVSGTVGLPLVALTVGVATLDLTFAGQGVAGSGAAFQLEGDVTFGPGSESELRCEPYTLAALERLLPVLNHELDAASVDADGSLRLSVGGVTVRVEPSDQYESWSYRGPTLGDGVAGSDGRSVSRSRGRVYCAAGGRLELYLET